MPLIKHGRAVDDPWTTATSEAELDRPGPLLVTLALWRDHRDRLAARNTPLGLKLGAGEAPDQVAADLERFPVVALEFPKFADGRAYSYARLLRERYGYTGEIRAVGEVLRDQLAFMHRSGFDAFEVADDRALDGWQAALAEIGVFYQPAGDDRATAAELRGRGRDAAVAANWAY